METAVTVLCYCVYHKYLASNQCNSGHGDRLQEIDLHFKFNLHCSSYALCIYDTIISLPAAQDIRREPHREGVDRQLEKYTLKTNDFQPLSYCLKMQQG